MTRLRKFLIRLSAFISKEIREVLRQPWLVLSLILGPFAILALFGLGYVGDPVVLNTVVVAPNDPVLLEQVNQYAETLGKQLRLAGTVPNEEWAKLISTTGDERAAQREALVAGLMRQYRADVVAGFPPDAALRIQNGQPAPLVLYYDTVDPLRAQYITSFGLIYTYEINRRVLTSAAEQTQGRATQLNEELAQMRQQSQAVRSAVQAGDRARASQEAGQLGETTDRVATAVEASAGLLAGVQTSVGGQRQTQQSQAAVAAARGLRREVGTFREGLDSGTSIETQARLNDLQRMEQAIDRLEGAVGQFNRIPPQVLAAPFSNVTQNVANVAPNYVTYYAPGVLALLLQHLAVSIAALSLVREKLLGALEVFRVGPLSPFEALVGKYISFIGLCFVLGAILLALLVYGLGVPIQGGAEPIGLFVPLSATLRVGVDHLLYTGLTLLLLITASLGVGFVISAISSSDSQAVQLSMIVLLASIFFSGFFLPLESLVGGARGVALMLPVTYAIQALQAAMLRGEQPLGLGILRGEPMQLNDLALWGLLALSIILFGLSLTLFRRQFRGE